jgi:hypothetical protein
MDIVFEDYDLDYDLEYYDSENIDSDYNILGDRCPKPSDRRPRHGQEKVPDNLDHPKPSKKIKPKKR